MLLTKKRAKVLSTLIIAMLVCSSCSEDALESGADCPNQVFGTSRGCVDDICDYSIRYGPSPCNYLVQETDEATYNFYQVEFGEENRCWEGDPPDLDMFPYSEGDDDCLYRVFLIGLVRDTECQYYVGYGPDALNYKVIPTNEATFNFYSEDLDFEPKCWEGEK